MITLKTFNKITNAGDMFSYKLAQHYFSSDISVANKEQTNESNIILIGSIIDWSDNNTYICGGGLLSSSSKLTCRPKSINLVRGPLTEESLSKQGFKTKNIFGDPGVLAAELYPVCVNTNKKIGIIPHYIDSETLWIKNQRHNENIIIIDVTAPLEHFFRQLQSCEVILSSSLHGIIFAHAYDKPALWIELSDKVLGDGFKFYDYYYSLGYSKNEINRIKINHQHTPKQLVKYAKKANLKQLRQSVREGIEITRDQLEKD